ncbi:SEC10/PgrA surface exclusion domain-containing protein [Streptococcus hyointestinalis]|uniref:SEC10/PgrA surface exclusion domain-containing protein n=1 Tax=Streptococcus hyointestinalis TaxID=1337 RepID=UPI001F155663|nr:SEC10/PgrA surface exclusion domain-containing protein [Streptococcus hyointestinalis]
MFKNKIQGHGSIKKLRTGAVVSVLALSVVGVSGVVSADEVTSSDVAGVTAVSSSANTATATNGTATNTDNETATASEVAKTEETKVSAEQVAVAQESANKANQAVTAQEGVVSSASSAVTSQEGVVADLNNQIKEADAISQADVDSAQVTANQANSALASANSAVASAEASVADTSSKVEAQEGVVAEAQASASETAQAVADAEKKVEALSTETDTSQLKQDVADLTTKVASDTENVQSAQDSLDAAKLAETNKAQAIEDQKAVVAGAETNVDKTAATYADALNNQKTAQSAEDQAKSVLDTAKAGTQVTEQVKVGENTTVTGDGVALTKGMAYSSKLRTNGVFTTQAYIDAIKALGNGTGSVEAVKAAIAKGSEAFPVSLGTLAAAGSFSYKSWLKQTKYTFADTDSTTKYAVEDLSDEQLTDLSLFYVALVNDIRAKVGSPLLTVTSESVALAKQTVAEIFKNAFPAYAGMGDAERRANGFWNSMSGLDIDAGPGHVTDNPLKTAGRVDAQEAVRRSSSSDKTIIAQEPANYVQYANNDGRKLTMAEFKGHILRAVGEQLYGTEGNGFIGEAYGGMDGVGPKDFSAALRILGLDGSGFTTAALDFEFTEIFNGAVDRAARMHTVLGNSQGTAIANPYMAVTNAKTVVTPIYETVTRTVVDSAKVAEAQTAYDSAVANNNTAKAAVASAEEAYTSAQEALANAQKQLSDLQSGTVDIPALEQALANAKAQLATDESSLQTAKETLALALASAVDKAKALETAKA